MGPKDHLALRLLCSAVLSVAHWNPGLRYASDPRPGPGAIHPVYRVARRVLDVGRPHRLHHRR